MGGEIRAADCCKCTGKKETNGQLLADAFSGHRYAMPCQVRDETYIRVRGKWTYLYRAVDRDGQTLEFMLAENRDTASARRFFKRAIGTNGVHRTLHLNRRKNLRQNPYGPQARLRGL